MVFLLCGINISWCSLKYWVLKISFKTDEGNLCLNLFKIKWGSLCPNSKHCQRKSTAQKPERRTAQKSTRNPGYCAIRWYQVYVLPERHSLGKATSMTALAQHCSSLSLWGTYPDKSLQLLNLFLRLGNEMQKYLFSLLGLVLGLKHVSLSSGWAACKQPHMPCASSCLTPGSCPNPWLQPPESPWGHLSGVSALRTVHVYGRGWN